MTTIGDKSEQSYGWGIRLDASVEDGGTVKIPTPDLDIRYTDTEHASVTAEATGLVYKHDDDRVTTSFDETEGSANVTVTNSTGAAWPPGTGVYVYCPHLLAEGDNEWDLKGQIYDLHQATAETDARLDAAEAAVRDLQTRVAALEPKTQTQTQPPKAAPKK
jgi:hypothetical protein